MEASYARAPFPPMICFCDTLFEYAHNSLDEKRWVERFAWRVFSYFLQSS